MFYTFTFAATLPPLSGTSAPGLPAPVGMLPPPTIISPVVKPAVVIPPPTVVNPVVQPMTVLPTANIATTSPKAMLPPLELSTVSSAIIPHSGSIPSTLASHNGIPDLVKLSGAITPNIIESAATLKDYAESEPKAASTISSIPIPTTPTSTANYPPSTTQNSNYISAKATHSDFRPYTSSSAVIQGFIGYSIFSLF